MRFPLVLAAAVFPASLFAAGTTAIGPCPPGFVQAGPSASGPVTILEGRTGGNVGCVPAPPLRAAEPAVQPTPFPTRDFRDPLPADPSVLRLVSYNPPSPTALAQQTSSRVLTRTYDLLDRVESETVPLEDGGTATVRYTYWRDGLRKTLTDAFGRVTFYEYDGQARLARVTANQGLPDQHVTEYTYWPDDLLKTIAAPNGVVTSYGYDLADRVTSIDIARDGVTLASYAYSYDANGNRLTQTETNGGAPELTTYTYDARDRLKTVTYPGGSSVEYGYDAVGNRTGETVRNPGGTVVSNKVAVFDAINRLSSVTDSFNPSNNATFAYDANGNLTSKTTAAGTETYDYEPRDLMVEARQGATVVARYAYDAFGRRYLKVASEGPFASVVRQYLYDQTSLLHELDDADLEVAKYEYGGDRLASLVRRDEPRRFYHQDALGSVVALSDSAGAVVARYHLDAWGRYRTPSELDASANRFGFTGYLFDQETSLYYAKARFYDPEYGRFTSQDSVLGEVNEPPSLHRYFYGYANPLRYVDPDGHRGLDKRDLIHAQDAFTGGIIGFGELVASPGVLMYDMLGAAGYNISRQPEYRGQWERWNALTERIGDPTPQRLLTVAFEEAEQRVTNFSDAIERGDALAAGHAMGGFIGQAPFLAEGSVVRVTPGPTLATTEGLLVPATGVALHSSAPTAAGILMAGSATPPKATQIAENTPSREDPSPTKETDLTGAKPGSDPSGARSGRRSGVPDDNFVPKENVGPYRRPRAAGPTEAQRRAVQGKPCVDCGEVSSVQRADHKDPLSVQHYREGQVNVEAQRKVDAVQPHCETCSSEQGGQLGAFGRRMKQVLQERTKDQ